MCGPVDSATHSSLRTHRLRVRHKDAAGRLASLDLAYHVAGHGPHVVVLVPGMCVSHQMWMRQVGHLLRDAGRHTLVLPDLRGTGGSGVDRSHYSVCDLARDVWHVVDAAVGRAARVHLVGHSMGAMIVQRAALLDARAAAAAAVSRRRVASLAVLGGHDGGWFWRFVPTVPMVRAALAVCATRFDPAVTADAFMRLHYTPAFLDGWTVCARTGGKRARRDVLLEQYLAPEPGSDTWSSSSGDDEAERAASDRGRRQGPPPDDDGDEEEEEEDPTFWRHLSAARSHGLSGEDARVLRELPYPKLAVYGRRDRVVLPRASRELAARIGADVVGVDAAHFLFDEAAADVNQLLDMHLERACDGHGVGTIDV